MPKRVSATAQAILGLLTVAPMSGYDLGQNIRKSVGHIWSESYGQIYPTLKKLADQGFLTSRVEVQKDKPDRRIYAITAKGREHLVKWLVIPPQPDIPRNEMLLKLFFGNLVPPSVLIRYVEHMVTERRALLKQFREYGEHQSEELKAFPDAVFWRMTARFGQLEMQAHLRWAEETLRTLRAMEIPPVKKKTARKKPHARR